MRSRWRVTGRWWSRRCRRNRSSSAAPSPLLSRAIGWRSEPHRGMEGHRRMLVVGALVHLPKQFFDSLERPAADLLDGRFELSPILALQNQLITRRIDAASAALDPGDHRRAPLAAIAPNVGKRPDRVDLFPRQEPRDFLGEPTPAETDARCQRGLVQADSAAHRST